MSGIEKAFDRVPRKVMELTMRMKGIQEVLIRSVVSLYEREKTSHSGFELSDEFEVKVGMHQGSVLSPFLFAVVADVVTEFARSALSCRMLIT